MRRFQSLFSRWVLISKKKKSEFPGEFKSHEVNFWFSDEISGKFKVLRGGFGYKALISLYIAFMSR